MVVNRGNITKAHLLGWEDGASFLEYVFVVTLIAIVALLAVRFFGLELNETFSAIGTSTASLPG